MSSTEVVIVDAVRSAVGRRNGSLSPVHPTDVLAGVLGGLFERTGVDPALVGQVVGGCVNQVGAQASNVIRTAWLTAGLPLEVPASTVNVQCGSAQQAHTFAHGLVAGGIVDIVVACGVESMSGVPMGSTIPRDPDVGVPRAGSYEEQYEVTSQFQGSDRIAQTWGISRDELDAYGLRSQELGAQAWDEGRFETQIVPLPVPVFDEDGNPRGSRSFDRDEGLRDTSLEALAGLRTNLADEPAFHTAGTSSQIADGAGALLMMTADKAAELGRTPMARVVASALVGSDPVHMLTGPIPATRQLLERSGLGIDDIDVFEINEAFASVVLAWSKELGPDMVRVNPNGGAIALGHPLGGTGAILLTKAIHELQRTGGRHGLVSMCCGGGLGTGTIVERI